MNDTSRLGATRVLAEDNPIFVDAGGIGKALLELLERLGINAKALPKVPITPDAPCSTIEYANMKQRFHTLEQRARVLEHNERAHAMSAQVAPSLEASNGHVSETWAAIESIRRELRSLKSGAKGETAGYQEQNKRIDALERRDVAKGLAIGSLVTDVTAVALKVQSHHNRLEALIPTDEGRTGAVNGLNSCTVNLGRRLDSVESFVRDVRKAGDHQ